MGESRASSPEHQRVKGNGIFGGFSGIKHCFGSGFSYNTPDHSLEQAITMGGKKKTIYLSIYFIYIINLIPFGANTPLQLSHMEALIGQNVTNLLDRVSRGEWRHRIPLLLSGRDI